MSISSHLTPEPERRLWTILETMRSSVDRSDAKIAALTAFAGAQLAFLKFMAPAGALSFLSLLSLSAAVIVGLFAFSPLTQIPKWLFWLDPPINKPSASDCFLVAEDIAKYAHSELVHRLEKYLGGGITATQYHEDLVGQVLIFSRIAARKQNLFRLACAVVGFGQLILIARLSCR